MNKLTILLLFFTALIVFSSAMMVTTLGSPTGHAVSTTPSQVVINNYVAIAMSRNLSNGIDFGVIATLPAIYHNATNNYRPNTSGYYISISNDSNKPVDFCVKADKFNTSDGDQIILGNYTWQDAAFTWLNVTIPQDGYKKMALTYVAARTNIGIGATDFYRFWLNVTVQQAAGTYNNTVWFQGVPTGTSCS
jgi:hypothetical protein